MIRRARSSALSLWLTFALGAGAGPVLATFGPVARLEGQDSGGRAAAKNKKAPKPRAKAKGGAAGRGKGKQAMAKPGGGTAAVEARTNAPAPQPAAAGRSEGAAPKASAENALAADADESIRKEGDSEVKVVEFGGLDIEGQLKTPQMLYFLNRLRAEFDRPQLPHRSFMPELQRGTRESGF